MDTYTGRPYDKDPAGHKQVRDFGHLLAVLNHIMASGPTFTERESKVGIVGVPMNVCVMHARLRDTIVTL